MSTISAQDSAAPRRVETGTTATVLALAPILIASDSASHGGVLALASLAVLLLVGSTRAVSPIFHDSAVRQIVGVIAVAAAVAAADLVLRATLPASHADLSTTLPLLAIVGYATWFTHPQSTGRSTAWLGSIRSAALLAMLPLIVGATRELLAHASLFAGASEAGLPAGFESQWSSRTIDGLLIAQRAPMAWLLLALTITLLRRIGAAVVSKQPSASA